MKEVWDAHQTMIDKSPTRSIYWAQQRVYEEADELRFTDPTICEEDFLAEGADVIISWMTTMKIAGISLEVALEAVKSKIGVIEGRFDQANAMDPSLSFDQRYAVVKEYEVYKE